MNKVFKVIWSEARNAYVVVSEIAKNHGSKSCSTKKLLTMLIATGVMTCASMAPAMAAPNVDASATVNVGKKAAVDVAENAKVNVKKDAKVNVEEGSNVSVDKNVTIGKGAVSSPYVGQTGNVAIGEKALAWNGNGLQEALMDFGQGGAKVKSFFGIPYGADIVDGTKLPGSIAIGKNTVARSGSTMIGDHGYTGKIGDTTITPDGNGIMKYNNDVYSTTIGANSFNSGALASVTGVFSIASSKYDGENYKIHAVQNTGATIYGSMNSIESATSDAKYSGIASSVLGFANKTQNANAALIWGTGNEVTNSIESIDIDYNGWNKLSVAGAQQKAIEAMQSSKYAGGSVMAIGGGNKADYAKYSQLTGVQNKVTGTEAKTAKYDFVNGYQNTVTNASDVTVIGIKNEVTADGNKVIGDNHKVSGKDNVIFGSADKVTETTVSNAVVLGHNAKVTDAGGVALGSGSVADRANAVSVGRRDANRQIINVAAGTEDTDAVNVSQLKDVKAEAEKHSVVTDGANITVTPEKATDGHMQYKVALKNDITLAGDDPDAFVSISGSKGTIWTSGSVTAGSVAVGTAKADGTTPFFVDSNGAFYAADGKFSVDKDGNANANSIQTNALNSKYNLSVGTANVNGTMPFFVNSNGAFYAANGKLVVDKDGKVTATEGKIGNVVLDNGVFTGHSALRDGELFVGDASGNYSQITTKGAKLGKVTVAEDGKISGVAAGAVTADSTDAVNGSQLHAVATEAGKHSKVVSGNNINVEETDVDGQKFYKVNMNKDIMLGDLTGKNVSISGTNGTIEATGAIATKDRVHADNGAKLADIDVTGNKISNGASSIVLDGSNVKVNDKVTFDQNGNIAGVNSIQTNALNAKYNLSVGTANENGIMPFFVNSNGAFYGANNNFSVDKDGKVTATAGEIGNVVLQNGVYTGHSALRDAELFVGDADGNYSQITPKSAKLGQVTIDEKGNMAGVNSIQTNALNAKYNLSVGTANENGIMPFFVNSNGAFYGANNNFSVDKDGKVTATEGEIGNVVLDNGVFTGHSALRDGELFVGDASGNYSQITTKGAKLGKVTVAEDGKISGVAAGAVTADSTDAVNGSQLHAVATEAGKHSKVVSGNNINVEETDVDGQKFYKVNMNKDIMLGDLTGKNVSISGTNGTIEATGAIATKDRVHADNGAKLADIDVTGNKISNGASSIVLDGSNVKVNDKVTIDQDGKISGVAAGEISSTSTDAINGSQLKETNDRVAANETAIKNNTEAISKLDGRVTANETAIKNNADAIGNLNTRVDGVEKLAKQHTTVAAAGDNITVTEDTNKDGGKEYKVALDKDINLDSVTTGQTVMNNDGLKVGKDVSVTATAVTAGQTSISNDGLKVNGKTYVSDSGLNANDQKITKVADGDISETSKDAVNGSQLYKTNQEVANNATNISSLSHSISNLDNRVNKVGAGAAALAALHPLDFDPDAKWDFAAGYGNYRGANAAAVGAYYRPNEDTMFSVGGTFGNGENMVNAGVSFKLGSGSSHVSTSRVAMAKEIKELRGELEAMKSAMLDANAGKKIDTSKLQLFPDVPQNHWAYEYVAQLAGNGMIEGYPDGNFAGDRPMTRYEFAAILYRAMTKGAVLSDKILSEFSHELEYFTVDTIAKDKAGNPTIQRVRTVKENKNK